MFHVERSDRSVRTHRYGICPSFESAWAVEPELLHSSFPDAELSKDHIQDLFDIDASGESPETRQGVAQIFRHKLLASALLGFGYGIAQSAQNLIESGPLPLASHKGWLGLPKGLACKAHEGSNQILHACPGHG
jgi:hypothetical protein